MKIEINVPDYSPEHGLQLEWEHGFIISARADGDMVVITANREGLVSLARLLFTLADERVPSGRHWHLDDSNALEDGSVEVIVEKY